MKTKKNTQRQVRKHRYRTFKVFGVVVLTLAALVLTSIIGTVSRNGRVRADNPYSQLNFTLPTGGTYTTRTLASNPFVIDPGTVPGTISLARYVPPAEGEHGYRGSVDACASLFALDNSKNGGSVNGDHGVPCTTVNVPDTALGDQTGLTGTAALDHRWVQGEGNQALVYQLPAPSNNALVFPSIDHNAGIYEAVEYTVWGLPAGTPLQAFTPAAPWVEGRLVRIFKDGWSPHAAGAPYCQSFQGDNHETDDYASVWSFRNATNTPVNISHVAILAGQSIRITPEPPVAATQDNINCFTEQINGSVGSGYYTSHDSEIDAVGISTAVTGCIGSECAPPPPCNFCTYSVRDLKGSHCDGDGDDDDDDDHHGDDDHHRTATVPIATQLQQNFPAWFPTGLSVGVNDGNGPKHNAIWNNVSKLQSYLDLSGTPGKLTVDTLNAMNRSQTGGGSLPSQVIALTINLRLNCAAFGNLVLCRTRCSGLDGKSLNTILSQANLFLANDPGYNLGLNASSLNALLDNLNRSYAGCRQSCFARDYLCVPQKP